MSILITTTLNSMSEKLLASISFISFSGDSSFYLWVVSLSPHFSCLFCFYVLDWSAFNLCLMEWPCVLGLLWDPVMQTPCSLDLDDLGMSFVWVIWTLLLFWGPACYWTIHWWELPSSWLRGSTHTFCMLLYRCWQIKAKQQQNKLPTSQPQQQYQQPQNKE